MPRILFFLLLVSGSFAGSGQSPAFITAEIAWSDDHYTFNDPGDRFEKPSPGCALFGIAVRKMIGKNVFLETGLYTRAYREGLAYKDDYSSSGSGRRFGQLPMRMGGRWQLFGDRLAIRPSGGLALNVTGNYDEDLSLRWGKHIYSTGDIVDYEDKTLYQTQVFFLVQAGLALEFRVGKRIYLGVSSSCNWGLQKIQLQQIRYSTNGGPFISAMASTRGGYNSQGGTLTYRFGK